LRTVAPRISLILVRPQSLKIRRPPPALPKNANT
jgi:hypothetical protein